MGALLDFLNTIQREVHTLILLPADFDGDGVMNPVSDWSQHQVAFYALFGRQRAAQMRCEVLQQVTDAGVLQVFEPHLWGYWKAYVALQEAAMRAPVGELDPDTRNHRTRWLPLIDPERALKVAMERLWFLLPAVETDAPPLDDKSDGPFGIDGFRWAKSEFRGLSPRAEKLLLALWSAKDRTIDFDDALRALHDEVDSEAAPEDPYGGPRKDANKFFRKHKVPLIVEIRKRVRRVSLLDEEAPNEPKRAKTRKKSKKTADRR